MVAEPDTQASDDVSPILVELKATREPADRVLEALDAALASDAPVIAHLRVPVDHPDRSVIARLCAADERVSVLEPDVPEPPTPADAIRISMPLAARPSVHTFSAIRERMAADGLGALEVRVPGPLPVGPRLRATGPGSGSGRVRASAVALGSHRAPSEAPPPAGTMAHERAEHLRHRARSATLRAQRDRHTQRLARERVEIEHQGTRVKMLERRAAAAGPGAWVAWRGHQATRAAKSVPWMAMRFGRITRSFARRARKHTIDRVRDRLMPPPEVPKAGQDDGR
jgi:hypothetical protein